MEPKNQEGDKMGGSPPPISLDAIFPHDTLRNFLTTWGWHQKATVREMSFLWGIDDNQGGDLRR